MNGKKATKTMLTVLFPVLVTLELADKCNEHTD